MGSPFLCALLLIVSHEGMALNRQLDPERAKSWHYWERCGIKELISPILSIAFFLQGLFVVSPGPGGCSSANLQLR
jgi:hypothetical protein